MNHGVASVVSAYCRYIDAYDCGTQGASRHVATLAEWAGWGSSSSGLALLRDEVGALGVRAELVGTGVAVGLCGAEGGDDAGRGGSAHGVGGVVCDGVDGVGVVDASGPCGTGVPVVVPVCETVSPVRGKNYSRNKAKRERLRARGSSVCPSLTSVRTVDTRTAEEIEATRTYALRRAAENKVAEAQAKFKLASYSDPDRVKAHKRLEAVRYAQRINEANAKSQASYKKCDESLKSLGSSGSAGELLLKQQVKKAQEDARMLKYAEMQLEYALQFASPAVHRHLAEMDPPQFESAHEIFGDPPDDYDADERAEYWAQLDQIDSEAAVRTARC